MEDSPRRAQVSALLDVYETLPFSIESGAGVHLRASDGREYLDFYGGHAVAVLGYGHPALVEALREQAQTLFFQSNLAPVAVRERAARTLLEFGPPGMTRVFFVNSGAEANENALRLAFRRTRRARVVAVRGAFHGRTGAAGAVTDQNDRWYAFPQAPFPVTFVERDDCEALRREVREDAAALILEPVQGVAGAVALSAQFLQTAREACSAAGATLIFDEVQCGMGRTGFPFAAQAYGVTPDILTVGKGLAGGFPAAAVLVNDWVAACVERGDLGTTFGGGPMACALVDTVCRTIARERLLPRVRRLSERMIRECVTGPVEAVQGMGFLLGLRTRPAAKAVLGGLRARGILAGGSRDPHVVRLLPPLILEDAHVDRLLEALKGLSTDG